MSESRSEFAHRRRLESQQARAEAAQQWRIEQDRQRECTHEVGVDMRGVRVRNGDLQYGWYCRGCDKFMRAFRADEPPPDSDDIPIVRDDRYQNPPCAVCGSFGTELHHWAPKEFFDWEADHWPTSYLCRDCHVRWHNTLREARQRAS